MPVIPTVASFDKLRMRTRAGIHREALGVEEWFPDSAASRASGMTGCGWVSGVGDRPASLALGFGKQAGGPLVSDDAGAGFEGGVEAGGILHAREAHRLADIAAQDDDFHVGRRKAHGGFDI